MLTDKEKREIWDSIPNNYTNWIGYANAIERAVLAKAGEQEPVFEVGRHGKSGDYFVTELKSKVKLHKGMKLYAHPAPQQAIPEGYQLAPMEPTESMIDAGVAMALQVSVQGEGGWSKYLLGLYKQMLSASPKP